MLNPRAAYNLVKALNDSTDGELVKSRDLVLLLLDHTPAPFSRDQFMPGHITCTGLVLDPARADVLLIHHGRLDRWLLPGGHVEPADPTLVEAARREVVEETGVLLDPDLAPLLVDIDVHGIPPGKGEPYHLHHDLLFAFRALSRDVQVSHESRDIAWSSRDQFDRYDLPRNVRRAVARLDSAL